MAWCLPTCAQGSSVSVTEFVEVAFFWGGGRFWVLPGAHVGGAGFAGLLPHVYRARVA